MISKASVFAGCATDPPGSFTDHDPLGKGLGKALAGLKLGSERTEPGQQARYTPWLLLAAFRHGLHRVLQCHWRLKVVPWYKK